MPGRIEGGSGQVSKVGLWLAILLVAIAAATATAAEQAVTIRALMDQPRGDLRPIWRFFGYDEANYTYSEDGRQMLSRIAALDDQPAYIRSHHLLTSGNGETWLKWSTTNAYSESAEGQPVYDWTILDKIFDTLHERRLRPLVEVGFMPRDLTVHPDDYTPPRVTRGEPQGAVGGGAFYPPNDYAKWEALVEAWVGHCVARYGRAEVETWLWEVWNEPNIRFWRGTPDEYLRLYDHATAAVKRVLPNARVGGPHVTNPTSAGSEAFLRQFLDHCRDGINPATGKKGAPLDFVAFHAKGGTQLVDKRVRMNFANHLATIDRGCLIVASYPQFRDLPVIVGESDPDGCAACSSEFFPQNAYRNGSQFASYTAATFLRKQAVAERHGVHLEGALTWAFVFPDQPWFAGFRTLSTRGVPKPVFNAFRMFSQLDSERVAVENSAGRDLELLMKPEARATTDVDAVATRGEESASVIVWHHHDDGVPGREVSVRLILDRLPPKAKEARLRHWRIDARHSNAYTAWQEMGSPQNPTPRQIEALKQASELTLLKPVRVVDVAKQRIELDFDLPRHAVSLVKLDWPTR